MLRKTYGESTEGGLRGAKRGSGCEKETKRKSIAVRIPEAVAWVSPSRTPSR